jgi:hypothetical protein
LKTCKRKLDKKKRQFHCCRGRYKKLKPKPAD